LHALLQIRNRRLLEIERSRRGRLRRSSGDDKSDAANKSDATEGRVTN
jgi:hypothetical protein